MSVSMFCSDIPASSRITHKLSGKFTSFVKGKKNGAPKLRQFWRLGEPRMFHAGLWVCVHNFCLYAFLRHWVAARPNVGPEGFEPSRPELGPYTTVPPMQNLSSHTAVPLFTTQSVKLCISVGGGGGLNRECYMQIHGNGCTTITHTP